MTNYFIRRCLKDIEDKLKRKNEKSIENNVSQEPTSGLEEKENADTRLVSSAHINEYKNSAENRKSPPIEENLIFSQTYQENQSSVSPQLKNSYSDTSQENKKQSTMVNQLFDESKKQPMLERSDSVRSKTKSIQTNLDEFEETNNEQTEWSVKIFTSNEEDSCIENEDPSIYITLIDSDSNETENVILSKRNHIESGRGNLFSKGKVDEFSFKVFSTNKCIKNVRIGTDSIHRWNLEKVELLNSKDKTNYIFICDCLFLNNNGEELCEHLFIVESKKNELSDRKKKQKKADEYSEKSNLNKKDNIVEFKMTKNEKGLNDDVIHNMNEIKNGEFSSEEENFTISQAEIRVKENEIKNGIYEFTNEKDGENNADKNHDETFNEKLNEDASEKDSLKTFQDENSLNSTENEIEQNQDAGDSNAPFFSSDAGKTEPNTDLIWQNSLNENKTKSVSFVEKITEKE